MKPNLLSLGAAIFLLVCTIASAAPTTAPVTAHLAEGGKALEAVIVSAGATDATKTAASELADYLGRISGANFEVKSGNGLTGIAVGRATDFPALNLAKNWDPQSLTQREDYLLRSHAHGLQVVGSRDLAVSHVVLDLPCRLGYRQYFPGKHWEIVPHNASLNIAIDVSEHPDYYARRIWYGFGLWDYNAQPNTDWCRKNLATSGIKLNTGHAYS